jgi:hypothetical protein
MRKMFGLPKNFDGSCLAHGSGGTILRGAGLRHKRPVGVRHESLFNISPQVSLIECADRVRAQRRARTDISAAPVHFNFDEK